MAGCWPKEEGCDFSDDLNRSGHTTEGATDSFVEDSKTKSVFSCMQCMTAAYSNEVCSATLIYRATQMAKQAPETVIRDTGRVQFH